MRTELDQDEQRLLSDARSAALAAYAPYSNFRVGAAVATDIGVFTGCNIENASYGLCICAERTALFRAIASGAKSFRRIAVACIDAAAGSGMQSRMPCGACRQVMSEFLPGDASVIVDGAGLWSVSELLPSSFELRPGNP